MAHNHFLSGQWNLICDVCGKKYKASDAKKRWDGFIVCPSDYETRQPQDFVKAKPDKISVPFTRPEPTDQFTTVNYTVPLTCTFFGSSGEAGTCVAGCAHAGRYVIGYL